MFSEFSAALCFLVQQNQPFVLHFYDKKRLYNSLVQKIPLSN